MERAGVGSGDQNIAPSGTTVEGVAASADQQVEHAARGRRSAATEDRGNAVDCSADPGRKAGLQIDDDTGTVRAVVQRGAAATENVAAQQCSVGELERIAAGTGCEVAHLT